MVGPPIATFSLSTDNQIPSTSTTTTTTTTTSTEPSNDLEEEARIAREEAVLARLLANEAKQDWNVARAARVEAQRVERA
eukprot:Pgem_evm1s17386